MNNLSGRERRLVVIFAVVLVVMAGYFLFGRGGGDPIVIEDVLPPVEQTPAVVVPDPLASPTFRIPPDARDPFTAG